MSWPFQRTSKRREGGLAGKNPALPANLFTSASSIAYTSQRREWVDIPIASGRLHTWIEYPGGEAKAPVVLLMHYDAGLDDLQRAIADQLATDGFIAVAPDLSGLGPNGGYYDSFRYPDDALRALASMPFPRLSIPLSSSRRLAAIRQQLTTHGRVLSHSLRNNWRAIK